MIDPVDGEDPNGIIKEYVIHPPAKVNFNIPALHIMTGKDPKESHLVHLRSCQTIDSTTRGTALYISSMRLILVIWVLWMMEKVRLFSLPQNVHAQLHIFITFFHSIPDTPRVLFHTNTLIFFHRRVP